MSPPVATGRILPAHEENVTLAVRLVHAAGADAGRVEAIRGTMREERFVRRMHDQLLAEIDVDRADGGSVLDVPPAVQDPENVAVEVHCHGIGGMACQLRVTRRRREQTSEFGPAHGLSQIFRSRLLGTRDRSVPAAM